MNTTNSNHSCRIEFANQANFVRMYCYWRRCWSCCNRRLILRVVRRLMASSSTFRSTVVGCAFIRWNRNRWMRAVCASNGDVWLGFTRWCALLREFERACTRLARWSVEWSSWNEPAENDKNQKNNLWKCLLQSRAETVINTYTSWRRPSKCGG